LTINTDKAENISKRSTKCNENKTTYSTKNGVCKRCKQSGDNETTEIYNLNYHYSQMAAINAAIKSPTKTYNTSTNESLTQRIYYTQ